MRPIPPSSPSSRPRSSGSKTRRKSAPAGANSPQRGAASTKREKDSQRSRAVACLTTHGMARLSELRSAGVTSSTVARLERDGMVARLARGLYQLSDAELDQHHTIAEAVKLAPRGVVCLLSALAFHELTDRISHRVWLAIGRKDWRPRFARPRAEFVRFSPERLTMDVEEHVIEGVRVRVTRPARTIIDLFRYRRRFGIPVAVSGLKAALAQNVVTPAEISRIAIDARIFKIVEPYLVALTIDD